MSKVAEKLNIEKVSVKKLPTLIIMQDKKREDLFKLQEVKVSAVDKKEASVMQAVAQFSKDYKQLKAPDMKKAQAQYDNILLDVFQLESAKTTKRTGKTKTTAKTKVTSDNKVHTPKEEKQESAPENKAVEKVVASFKHYCETSSVKCYPLTPDNNRKVETSLKHFELLTRTLHDELSEEEMKALRNKDSIRAIDSVLNSTTIRLLITEKSKDKKTVAQYLLKPVYVSPYSFLAVVEAHKRNTKLPSMYEYLINSVDSDYTCYDSFQFNPLQLTLTTAEVEETKNKVEFRFVNIKVE